MRIELENNMEVVGKPAKETEEDFEDKTIEDDLPAPMPADDDDDFLDALIHRPNEVDEEVEEAICRSVWG